MAKLKKGKPLSAQDAGFVDSLIKSLSEPGAQLSPAHIKALMDFPDSILNKALGGYVAAVGIQEAAEKQVVIERLFEEYEKLCEGHYFHEIYDLDDNNFNTNIKVTPAVNVLVGKKGDWFDHLIEKYRKNIAELERITDKHINDFFEVGIHEHKAKLLHELNEKIKHSTERITNLENKKSELEGQIRLAEKGLKEIGIPFDAKLEDLTPQQRQQMVPHVNKPAEEVITGLNKKLGQLMDCVTEMENENKVRMKAVEEKLIVEDIQFHKEDFDKIHGEVEDLIHDAFKEMAKAKAAGDVDKIESIQARLDGQIIQKYVDIWNSKHGKNIDVAGIGKHIVQPFIDLHNFKYAAQQKIKMEGANINRVEQEKAENNLAPSQSRKQAPPPVHHQSPRNGGKH